MGFQGFRNRLFKEFYFIGYELRVSFYKFRKSPNVLRKTYGVYHFTYIMLISLQLIPLVKPVSILCCA